ncbi:Signal transduction histidine kinase [Rhodoferax sp. OV413]|uniref:sensor histidine kinase n=1 Tax=Rhodoferax sp. OV413 TaxID=1855285 RepID=UPI0008852410|nr:HAMP domain-containing sensor histidine kinase [Rhodoferax sp. OV413]SDP90145.1 Signal transduction histidine kinase [Rhodoferax sp. OV413]
MQPTLPALLQRLYVRIWLAVLLAVAVLTLLVGWAWRVASDPPLHELVIRNKAGEIIGKGTTRQLRVSPDGVQIAPPASAPAPSDGPDDLAELPPPIADGTVIRGPEFVVRMHDGQRVLIHLPRPERTWWMKPPFGFFWTLGLVGLAMALAMYPIIRRLTRRLESLQRSVEQWGAGDLSVRVPIHGRDEAGLLAQRFNTAAERIETLVASHKTLLQSQKSLLANASHELRSPLTRIRMGIELMGSSPSPSFKNEINRNIAELDQLVDEILLASRLDAKEADLGTVEEVDLIGLAAEECARLDAALEVGSGEDDAEQAFVVQGVAKLLRRAIRNLLENARRYTSGEVSVSLQQRGAFAVLRVFDHGPGVPVELRERIFEPFYRLPGASERDGGVGLGLALVKSIAERHGGSVRCEGRDGGGACFVIELPC